MANAVYDRDTEDDQQLHPHNPDPLDNKAAGDSPDPRTLHKDRTKTGKADSDTRSDLHDAESSGGKLFNPEGDHETGTTTSGSLLRKEKSGTTGSSGGGGNFQFNDSDKGSRVNQALQAAVKHKKEIGIGVGAGGGLATVVLLIFFMLIPLKIEHVVENLQNRFFASSQTAVQSESNYLLKRYLRGYVMPNLKTCGKHSTLSKECRVIVTGKGPVSSLYRTWANARLENRLATDYGIEIQYHPASNRYYIKAPGTNTKGDDIGPKGAGIDGEFQRTDRVGVKNAFNDAIEHETLWKRVMLRYKFGRLFEERYGGKRFLFYDGTGDSLGDSIANSKDSLANKKIASKLALTQRVIIPRNQTLGIAIECLLTDCGATDTKPTNSSDNPALEGGPESETDQKVRQGLTELAAKYGATNIDELVKTYNTIAEDGFQKYLVTTALKPVIGDAAAGATADAIPLAGWMDLAARLVNSANNASKNLKKLKWLANAPAAVALYMEYRSYADEVHTGHVDATELGSMVGSLSPGNHGASSDPIVGGTAGAENTPLYPNLIDHQQTSSDGKKSSYVCNSGNPVAKGELICPEESLGGGNATANGIKDWLNSNKPITVPGSPIVIYPKGIATVAQVWKDSIGKIFDLANGVIGILATPIVKAADASCSLPGQLNPLFAGYCVAREETKKILPAIAEGVTKWLIPDPFSTNMSGGRTFDLMAVGADVAGNDYAHSGLGGRKLNPKEVADIVNQQQADQQSRFQSQSLFARMFDTNSQYSLITKVAMAMPFGWQADAQSGAASMLNPLGAVSRGFGSIFSSKADAAMTPQADFAGVPQYGLTQNDIDKLNAAMDAEGGPDAYWDNHCSDDASKAYTKDNSWNKAASGDANADPDTGMPVNTTINPCLFIKSTVGILGGKDNTDNLTKDDLADLNGSGGNGQSGGASDTGNAGNGGGPAVSGDEQQLAKQILGNSNIHLVGRYTTNDIQNTANGQPAYNNVKLDIGILQFLLDLASQGNVYVSSITGDGTGHSAGSNHYTGNAVDLECLGIGTKVATLNQTAAKYNGKNNGERCDRPNPYGYPPHDHYDFFN